MNFKAAIFDMDGTLIDSLNVWNIIWKSIGDSCGFKNFKPNEEHDKLVRTMLFPEAMDLICDNYNLGKSSDQLLRIANTTIKKFYNETVTLKDGVLEFLEYLQGKNIKMCIASATDIHLLKLAINHCKIEKYFNGIISCAEVKKGKDKPDVFIKAAEFLGTKINETCVFEDSFTAIKTASNVGFITVGIYDKNNYFQEEIKKNSDIYISRGDTLRSLIK